MEPVGIFIVIIAAMLVTYSAAARSSGGKHLQTMTKRVIDFDVPESPDTVIACLLKGVPGSAATLDASEPDRHRLVFATKPKVTNWGFFFPVYVTAAASGGSKVAVGVTSRAFQVGPLVTKAHRAFVAQIQDALAAARQTA